MSHTKIAQSRHMSKSSVSDVFRIAQERSISFEEMHKQQPEEVYELFYPDKHASESIYKQPDYDYIHSELSKIGVTLKLLWNEYRDKKLLKVATFQWVIRSFAQVTPDIPKRRTDQSFAAQTWGYLRDGLVWFDDEPYRSYDR